MTTEELKDYLKKIDLIKEKGIGVCPKCEKGTVKRMEYASNEYRCNGCDFKMIIG